MKPPAKDTHRKLKSKLEELCKSPVPGEASAAKHKLSRLLARYDFDAAAEPVQCNDLFSSVRAHVSPGTAQHLFTFETAESDIASLTRWAIGTAFDLPTCIRAQGTWKSAIWIEANAAAMPELQRLSANIRTQFITLWRKLRASAEVEEADRRPFMLGLYDGMMDDPRQLGQRLPSRVIPKRKKKAKKQSLAQAPGLATHPYTLAVGLGRQIRLSASLAETIAALEDALSLTEKAA